MSEVPMPYEPDLDQPLTPIDPGQISDPRAQAVAEKGAGFQAFIRSTLPAGPWVEAAARYVDLAVQAATRAGQESPPGATGAPAP